MTSILVFGDSITYGADDTELGGWVNRLKLFFNSSDIYNLGICGDRTDDIIRRFKFETEQRLEEGEKDYLVVFAVGINDSQFVSSKKEFRTPIKEFENNILELIQAAEKISKKIVFVGLTSVNESKTAPCSWNKNKSYKNEYIKKFNDIIQEIGKKSNSGFVEIYNKFIISGNNLLSEDGLHPNSEGHERIFHEVKSFLMAENLIKI